jgi:hypothetical protein
MKKGMLMDWMSFAVGFLANFAFLGILATVMALKTLAEKKK